MMLPQTVLLSGAALVHCPEQHTSTLATTGSPQLTGSTHTSTLQKPQAVLLSPSTNNNNTAYFFIRHLHVNKAFSPITIGPSPMDDLPYVSLAPTAMCGRRESGQLSMQAWAASRSCHFKELMWHRRRRADTFEYTAASRSFKVPHFNGAVKHSRLTGGVNQGKCLIL